MANKLRQPPVIWMTIMGIISGILSSFKLGPLGDLQILQVPIQQGVLFGAVIAIGLYQWGKTCWPGALIAFLTVPTVLIAWITAHTSFTFLYDDTNAYAAGVAAGAIGAAGTVLAGAITEGSLRKAKPWLTTIIVGAILGILTIYATKGEDIYLLILFVPWQAMVAGSIGYALANQPAASATATQ